MSLGSFRLSHGRRAKNRTVAQEAVNQPVAEPALVAGLGAVTGVTPKDVARLTAATPPSVTVRGDESSPADAVTPVDVAPDGTMSQGETVGTNPTPSQPFFQRGQQQHQGRNPNRR